MRLLRARRRMSQCVPASQMSSFWTRQRGQRLRDNGLRAHARILHDARRLACRLLYSESGYALLRIIGRVSEDAREEAAYHAVGTLQQDALLISGHELIVEQQQPYLLK